MHQIYVHTWDNVTSNTIKNCWQKADILPTYSKGSDDENDFIEDYGNHANNVEILLELKCLKEMKEVQVLIDKFDFDNPFTAKEFVEYDKSEITTEMMSNEKILEAVLSPNDQEKEMGEEKESLPTITYNEAVESYDKVILYLEQQENDFDAKKEDLNYIKKLRKDALKQRFISARQVNLDKFINIIE